MPAAPIPHFDVTPAGIAELRSTILSGATSLDLLHASRACRSQFYEGHRLLAAGRVKPENVPGLEDRMVAFTLMERVLADLAGAVAAAERAEGTVPPFETIGSAVRRVLPSLDPARQPKEAAPL